MGVILGVFVALGLITVVAIVSFKHMWNGSNGYEDMTTCSKVVASLFFIGMVLTMIVAAIIACTRP